MNIKIIHGYRLWLLLLLAAPAAAQVPAQTVPAFRFLQLDQKPFTSNNLPAGKPLFFVFFDPGCEHCQRTISYIDQHYNAFSKAALLLVSMDSLSRIQAFMATYGKHLKTQKNITILQDRQYQFITLFKPKKYPAMFLYSAGKKLLAYEDDENTISRFAQTINNNGK